MFICGHMKCSFFVPNAPPNETKLNSVYADAVINDKEEKVSLYDLFEKSN